MSTRYHLSHTKHTTDSFWKRGFNVAIANDMTVSAVDGSNNEYSTAAETPPITITVVQILPPDLSTSIHSHSTTQSSASIVSLETVRMSAATSTQVNTLPSQIPISLISLASSIPQSSSTSFTSTPSGSPLPQDAQTLSRSSLNLGVIAGVVIACILTFLIGIFFAIRIRFKRKRMSKLRKTWPRSSVVGVLPYGIDTPESSYEPKPALGNGNHRALALSVQIPSPRVSVPPISYNNDAVPQYTTPPSSSPSAFTSPVYLPGLTFVSPYTTNVLCTFIPSLPDELTVRIGETLHVLAEYEDGWSLCKNCRGEQGMVPNECLDRKSSSMEILLPTYDYRHPRSSTRVTSLAQAVRPGH